MYAQICIIYCIKINIYWHCEQGFSSLDTGRLDQHDTNISFRKINVQEREVGITERGSNTRTYFKTTIIKIIFTAKGVEQWSRTDNPEIDLNMWESSQSIAYQRREGMSGENVTSIPASAKTFRLRKIKKILLKTVTTKLQ